MTSLLYDHPFSVTHEELIHDLFLLPEWRRKKALSYRFQIDRVLCTKAFLLLQQGLKDYYGIEDELVFEYTSNGKPILRDYPEIHFNLSHCKRGVLCVIDKKPIGCDIEEIEPKLDLDLCHECFNNKEITEIISSSAPCLEFTKLWTMKESYLKMEGKGINDNISTILTLDLQKSISFEIHTCLEKGFVYTICQYK